MLSKRILNIFLSVFCLFLVFASPQANAQNYTLDVQHYGPDEGLLHRSTFSAMEDEQGYLWVGSLMGLQRFDGSDFKSWSLEKSHPLFSNISALGLDNDGWIWAWNNDIFEFVFIHTVTEEVMDHRQRFGDAYPTELLPENGWRPHHETISRDPEGRLVFVSSQPNQTIRFDSGKNFSKEKLPVFDGKSLRIQHVDKNGNLWIKEGITYSTLHLLDPSCQLIRSYDLSAMENSLVMVPSDDGVVIGPQNPAEGLAKTFSVASPERKTQPWSTTMRSTWMVDGKRWQITEKEVRVFEEYGSVPLYVQDRNGFPSHYFALIKKVIHDRRGRIWMYGEWGLLRVLLKPNRFRLLLQEPANRIPEFNNSTRGILDVGDTVFANLDFSGLVAIPKDSISQWSLVDEGDQGHYYGRDIIELQTGQLASVSEGELKIFSRNGNLLKVIKPPIPHLTLWSLYQAADGTIWIGTDRGLAYWIPEENAPLWTMVASSGGPTVSFMEISSPEPGLLWVCTEDGLHSYHIDQEKFERLSATPTQTRTTGDTQLPHGTYYTVYVDDAGIRWLGTTMGLIHMNPKTKKVRLFSKRDGFPDETIYTVFEDRDAQLWMSSNKGLIRFDKNTHQVTTYTTHDGITHDEFNRLSGHQGSDGTLYFGGLNGITSFDPATFVDPEDGSQFHTRISDFQIMRGATGELENETGQLRQQMSFDYYPDDLFFRLKWAIPILDNPNQEIFAWKIDGQHEVWNIQNENEIQLYALPYGTHSLRIKAQVDNGTWTDELQIEIRVRRPFYLQAWFILAMLLLLLGLVVLFLVLRTRQYRKRQAILEEKVSTATAQIGQDKAIIEQQASELLELDRVKSRFFANVSHELRTPLTLIMGPINSAIKSGDLNPRNLKFLHHAQRSGKDLLKLVGSILDLSKMESGKLLLHESPVLLFETIRQQVSTFESFAQQFDQQLTFEFQAPAELNVLVDREKLETIISNLLSNAIKYSRKSGKITVLLSDSGASLKLSIADTGRGIHPDELPKIFDRFYQARHQSSGSEGGTGIGLALSRELARIMGGSLTVESQLNVGSTFTLEIPRKEVLGVPIALETESDMLPEEQEELLPIQSGEKTILVVEDNYSLRDYLSTILQDRYTVLTAANGKLALQKLEEIGAERLPDVILTDIMMPEMDGYELLSHLKADQKYRLIPVIMLTARAAVEDKLKALRIGVDDYLLKPFEENELTARIENLVRNAESRAAFIQDDIAQSREGKAEPSTSEPIASADLLWLAELESTVQNHLSSDLLTVSFLAETCAMSNSTLLRQLKRLTGLSPAKYIQEHRMNMARRFLEAKSYKTVAEVAYHVGFKDAKAFSRSFKQRFGKSPSDFF